MSHFWIYIHTNKKNGKRYVGITTMDKPEMRWHGGSSYCQGSQPLFARAIKKHGWDGFDHTATLCEDEEEMLFLEQFYIKYYDTTNPQKGYNNTTGGEHPQHSEETRALQSRIAKERFSNPENHPMYGKHMSEDAKRHMRENHADMSGENNPRFGKHCSEETKEKIGSKNRGRKLTDEHKKKISDLNKGKPKSEEWKKHMSELMMGNQRGLGKKWDDARKEKYSKMFSGEGNPNYGVHRPCTEETKKKLSENHKGKPKSEEWKRHLSESKKGKPGHPKSEEEKAAISDRSSIAIVQLGMDGDFISKFKSATEAKRVLGIDNSGISKCCKHQKDSYGNFKWMYLDEYLANGGVLA